MNSSQPENNVIQWVLRADKIRPGDVLLTNGGEKMSQWIDSSTGRKGYSHAALCVSSLMTYESDGELIGVRPLYPLAFNLQTGARYSLAPANPIRAGVFRHPKMPPMEDTERTCEFEDAYQSLMLETLGGDYAYLTRLTTLANTGSFKKRFFNAYANWKDSCGQEKKVCMSFCSELVAQFFKKFGLPLFRDGRRPEKATPNDLAGNAQCFLEQVPEAVVQWPAEGDYSLIDRETDPLWRRYPPGTGDNVESLMHEKRLTKKALDELFETLKKIAGA
jgi:hypothetical protein